MTASHCIEKKLNNPGSVYVVAGAQNKDERESSQQRIQARRIIKHPQYKQRGGLSDDVALIELSSPLRLNDRVVKACMPTEGVYPTAGKNCYLAGKIFLEPINLLLIF